MDSRMTIRDRMRSHRFLSTLLVVLTLFVGILIGTVIQRGVRGATKAINTADATPLKVPAPLVRVLLAGRTAAPSLLVK